MKRISAAALLALMLFSLPVLGGREKFISTLYQQKRYFDSIGEALRLKHEVSPQLQVEIDYFVSGNYFLGRQFYSVINRAGAASTGGKRRDALLLARAFIGTGDYRSALSVLEPSGYRGKKGPLDSDLMAARVTALLRLGRFRGAEKEVKGFHAAAPFGTSTEKLEESLSAWGSLPYRSPWFSAVASGILPGAGQACSGRYLAAFLSFLSVAVPLTGGVFLLREGKKELAGTLFLFSAVFYGGNIYGAWNAAEYFNRRGRRRFTRSLEKNLPPYDPMRHLHYPALTGGREAP